MFHFLTMYQNIQQGSGVRPSQPARPQNRPKQTRPQKRPQKTKPQRRPQQSSRPSNNNKRQQGNNNRGNNNNRQHGNNNRGSNNNGGSNDPRLSVMCPSAMLCVPKPNCDFKGVITDVPLNNLSPEIEALRVPYLVSFFICFGISRRNNCRSLENIYSFA